MIKIRLEKWERAVVIQVLEMDESLRGKGEIFINGEMRLKSMGYPSMLNGNIFLRGVDKDEDYLPDTKVFEKNSERDTYYNHIVKLFQDYNNREKPEVKESENIFILE